MCTTERYDAPTKFRYCITMWSINLIQELIMTAVCIMEIVYLPVVIDFKNLIYVIGSTLWSVLSFAFMLVDFIIGTIDLSYAVPNDICSSFSCLFF